jgi:hypothetical protein
MTSFSISSGVSIDSTAVCRAAVTTDIYWCEVARLGDRNWISCCGSIGGWFTILPSHLPRVVSRDSVAVSTRGKTSRRDVKRSRRERL